MNSRIPAAPTGIGTASVHLPALLHGTSPLRDLPAPAPEGGPFPLRAFPAPPPPAAEHEMNLPGGSGSAVLLCPPAVRDDPVLTAVLDHEMTAWADELNLYTGERRQQLIDGGFTRAMVMCHPDSDDPDRLMAAVKWYVAENVLDDYYCDDPELTETEKARLGARLSLAQAATEPPALPAHIEAGFWKHVDDDPVLTAQRSAMDHLERIATGTQLDRMRHYLAVLYLGYQGEKSWRRENRMPSVWEYLTNRQFNNFRPAILLTDTVGGYEIPPQILADPQMRRCVDLACNCSTIVNDLYSVHKDAQEDGLQINLPQVIATEEKTPLATGYEKAIGIHNDLITEFQHLSLALALTGGPLPTRFLTGLWNWLGGNRHWHATNTRHKSPFLNQ